jgi:hypothetical protein
MDGPPRISRLHAHPIPSTINPMNPARWFVLFLGLLCLPACRPGAAGSGPDDDSSDRAGDPAAWNLRPVAADLPFLAVDRQSRGVYPVGSRVRDREAPGGFGPCANYPKDLGDHAWGDAGRVSLVAFPDEAVEFGKHRGLAVRLVNRTDQTVAFQVSDSCLYLVQEARTAGGQWRPIEFRPDPSCGNSFHRVFLKKGQYWEFPAPRYDGRVKTAIRLRLDPGGDRDPARPPIYSQEFEGAVEPIQFKPAHDARRR